MILVQTCEDLQKPLLVHEVRIGQTQLHSISIWPRLDLRLNGLEDESLHWGVDTGSFLDKLECGAINVAVLDREQILRVVAGGTGQSRHEEAVHDQSLPHGLAVGN